tara:strand:- start:38 stop:1264 length:1227 start_codon:yes stop_codon:yes gene_type:complete
MKAKPEELETAAVYAPIADLHPWEDNPRNNEGAVSKVAESIKRFGFGSPIIARKANGMIIAGHTRWLASQSLGLDKVPVRYLDLDEVDAKLLAISDNSIGEIAEWEPTTLAAQLDELKAHGVDLDVTGWGEDKIDEILQNVKSLQPVFDPNDEEIPPSDPTVPISSSIGTVYKLGPHRLICGDCRDHKPESFGCLIFDPPWDDQIATEWEPPGSDTILSFTDGARSGDLIARFGSPTWIFVWDGCTSWWTPNRPLRRIKMCLWFGDLESYNQEGAFYRPENWTPDEEAREVWNSHYGGNPQNTYTYTPHPSGRRLSDLYRLPLATFQATQEHRHAKPVEWLRCLIANTSKGAVYDPFAGGGASLLAAASLDRVWTGVEIDPANCDIIRRRWTRYAEKKGIDAGPDKLF